MFPVLRPGIFWYSRTSWAEITARNRGSGFRCISATYGQLASSFVVHGFVAWSLGVPLVVAVGVWWLCLSLGVLGCFSGRLLVVIGLSRAVIDVDWLVRG